MSEFPRALTAIEHNVLDLLLSAEFPGVTEYRAQLANAIVTSRCPCGCLEFTIEVPTDAGAAPDHGNVTAWSEEQQVFLGLETAGGRLVGVGLMWFGTDEVRIEPDLTTFEVRVEPVP